MTTTPYWLLNETRPKSPVPTRSLVCAECGNPFQTKKQHGAKYCGTSCHDRAWKRLRARPVRVDDLGHGVWLVSDKRGPGFGTVNYGAPVSSRGEPRKRRPAWSS